MGQTHIAVPTRSYCGSRARCAVTVPAGGGDLCRVRERGGGEGSVARVSGPLTVAVKRSCAPAPPPPWPCLPGCEGLGVSVGVATRPSPPACCRARPCGWLPAVPAASVPADPPHPLRRGRAGDGGGAGTPSPPLHFRSWSVCRRPRHWLLSRAWAPHGAWLRGSAAVQGACIVPAWTAFWGLGRARLLGAQPCRGLHSGGHRCCLGHEAILGRPFARVLATPRSSPGRATAREQALAHASSRPRGNLAAETPFPCVRE